MRRFWIFVSLFAFLSLPSVSLGHGGGLDSLGCHHNRKQGGYHCHRGLLAGRYFSSKNEALQTLSGLGTQPVTTPQPSQRSTGHTDSSEEIGRLWRKVSELERRIEVLETKPKSPTTQTKAKASQPSGNWRDKKNWRRLQRGMTKSQVRDLLGEPTKVAVYSVVEIWRYGYVANVKFDNRGRVTGWAEQ